jgi:hypothetical protein
MNGGPGEIVSEPKCDGDYDDEECEHVNMLEQMEQPGRPDQWVKGIDDWRDGFYEPMGYHIGGTGWIHGRIWGTKKKREHIYSYCPEAKMVLEMDWAPFVPGYCAKDW